MEEDHSTPSSHTQLHMAAGLLPMAAAPLSLFFSSLHVLTHSHFSHNSLCTLFIFALKYSLLYRHFMVNMEGPIALKHATICGINGATTCLVVGYCHKMAIS